MLAYSLSPVYAICLYIFKQASVGCFYTPNVQCIQARMDLTVLQLKNFKTENFQLRRVNVNEYTEEGGLRGNRK